MDKSLNTYKPFIKITCNGLMFKIVHNSFNSIKIKFGISKIMINSEEYCTCGFKDCFNVCITVLYIYIYFYLSYTIRFILNIIRIRNCTFPLENYKMIIFLNLCFNNNYHVTISM